MEKSKLDSINKALLSEFGIYSDGRPKWRLIMNSKYYTEKRYGAFLTTTDIVGPNGQMITLNGIDECVKEVPKYNWIKEGIYLLEQLYFTENLPDELKLVNENLRGIYEMRWAFQDGNNNYMEPTLEGCRFIAYAILEKNTMPKETKEDETNRFKKNIIDDLDKKDPVILYDGHYIFKDSTKEFKGGESSTDA